LAPTAGEMLWDIGSGSGSIAIEWMRAGQNLRAIAFEKDGTRVKTINTNAFNLGVTRLKVIEGSAPDVLPRLIGIDDKPDAIFIGGGLSKNANIINVAWDALKPGGRLVANAVTIKSEAVLFNFADEVAGELSRINIERQEKIGGQVSFRPLKAVTQLVVYKPEKNNEQ
ncbi:MAG: precorrin-6Y C5,15-methyltransferase (decarboxylating) subunit CbiT, partial [Rhodospirillaceae bacterium]|nr:precorrin-6Y C5,15-methyltransferase (decarboxylating) subunit CbiT [Rhodospirillaceae bacterium]